MRSTLPPAWSAPSVRSAARTRPTTDSRTANKMSLSNVSKSLFANLDSSRSVAFSAREGEQTNLYRCFADDYLRSICYLARDIKRCRDRLVDACLECSYRFLTEALTLWVVGIVAQAERIGVGYRVIPHIRIKVESRGQPNRVFLGPPPRLLIVPAIPEETDLVNVRTPLPRRIERTGVARGACAREARGVSRDAVVPGGVPNREQSPLPVGYPIGRASGAGCVVPHEGIIHTGAVDDRPALGREGYTIGIGPHDILAVESEVPCTGFARMVQPARWVIGTGRGDLGSGAVAYAN